MNTPIRTIRLTDEEWTTMKATALTCNLGNRSAWLAALLASREALEAVEQILRKTHDNSTNDN